MIPPLPAIMIEPSVRAALLEDLGRAGDLTTDAIVPADARTECALVARQPGVVAGLDFAVTAFRLIDPAIEVQVERPDGSRLTPRRPDRDHPRSRARHADRRAHRAELPVPSQRRRLRHARHRGCDRGDKAQVVCTRKTMPGLRAAQKYAVRVGGGSNHRFGLDDAVLIKDNHVAIAGGVRRRWNARVPASAIW